MASLGVLEFGVSEGAAEAPCPQLEGVPAKVRSIARSFAAEYMADPLVAGVLLTGSYANGSGVSKYSDIDISLVLDDLVRTQKRGSRMVDGYLVEYTACPFRCIRDLFHENRDREVRHIARKYATGIILADRGGVAELQAEAAYFLKEPIRSFSSDPFWAEMSKYYLLDQLLNVQALHEQNSGGFRFAYFAHIQKILDTYGKFLGVEILRPERLHQFLNSEQFCVRYGIDQFPDSLFMEMAAACMEHEAMEDLKRLSHYVIDEMGGFSPDGWLLEIAC